MDWLNHLRYGALLLATGVILVGCGGGGAASGGAVSGRGQSRGESLYAANCAACHGQRGEGVQGLGKNMAESTFIAEMSEEELWEFLKVGRTPTDPLNTTGVLMPPKGGNPTLSDEQLMEIIAFMRSIHE